MPISRRQIKSVEPKQTRKTRTKPRKAVSAGKLRYLTKKTRKMINHAQKQSIKNLVIKDVCQQGRMLNTQREKYDLQKKIGEGAYGKVYLASRKGSSKNELVVKVQRLVDDEALIEFNKESELTKMLSAKHNIGPKFFNAWYCTGKSMENTVGYIVAEKMDGDLLSLLNPNKNSYKFLPNVLVSKKGLLKFLENLQLLHNLNYVHADLMPKNVLVKVKTQDNFKIITDLVMTDFGLTDKKEVLKSNPEWLETLYDYTKQNYRKTMSIKLNDVMKDPSLLDLEFVNFLESNVKLTY